MRHHNPRRGRFRSSSRSFRRNGGGQSIQTLNFGIKGNNFNRNSQNAPRMVEKYVSLAKEALSSGDKILSENYFQHADHFSRIIANKNSLQNNSDASNTKKEDSNSFSKDKI